MIVFISNGQTGISFAQLCNGQIIGIDRNQSLLDSLTRKIEKAGLSHRVHTLKCSLFDLDFPDESFDIIRSEGSIFVIGFKKGLSTWRRFIKPTGFLVVHDESKNFTKKREQISHCGYTLVGHFIVSGTTWWKEYYDPLENHIEEIRIKYGDNPTVVSACDIEQKEIDMVKKNINEYGSVFFVMQKDSWK